MMPAHRRPGSLRALAAAAALVVAHALACTAYYSHSQYLAEDAAGATGAAGAPALLHRRARADPPVTVNGAEQEYLNAFLDKAEWQYKLKWMPHMSHEQGFISICVRFEFRTARRVTGADVEAVRSTIERGVNEWERALHGTPHWNRTTTTPVYVFGIGKTKLVDLTGGPKGIPVYTNDQADCDTSCSRFVQEKGRKADYSKCAHPSTSDPSVVTTDHYDFHVWYSDWAGSMPGAAGHGGDWGIRILWSVHVGEQNSKNYRVTDHELGHTGGMPDIYDSKVYPPILRGYKRPWCIMAHAPKVSNFDRVMARGFWAKSLGHGLDTIMTTAATPGGYSCQDDDTAGAWLPQYSCRKFASFNWCTHDFYGINVRFRCPVSCGLTKSNPKCKGLTTTAKSITTTAKPTTTPTPPPSSTAVEWLLAPRDRMSCTGVCAAKGLPCDAAALKAAGSTQGAVGGKPPPWNEFFKQAGVACKQWLHACKPFPNSNSRCASWGAPYVHENHVTEGQCQTGTPTASCSATGVGKHRRLCPCTRRAPATPRPTTPTAATSTTAATAATSTQPATKSSPGIVPPTTTTPKPTATTGTKTKPTPRPTPTPPPTTQRPAPTTAETTTTAAATPTGSNLCTTNGIQTGSVTKKVCRNTPDVCEVYIKKGNENGVSKIESCRQYCDAYNMDCTAQYGHTNGCGHDDKYDSCDVVEDDTSDHICQCGKSSAPYPMPGPAPTTDPRPTPSTPQPTPRPTPRPTTPTAATTTTAATVTTAKPTPRPTPTPTPTPTPRQTTRVRTTPAPTPRPITTKAQATSRSTKPLSLPTKTPAGRTPQGTPMLTPGPATAATTEETAAATSASAGAATESTGVAAGNTPRPTKPLASQTGRATAAPGSRGSVASTTDDVTATTAAAAGASGSGGAAAAAGSEPTPTAAAPSAGKDGGVAVRPTKVTRAAGNAGGSDGDVPAGAGVAGAQPGTDAVGGGDPAGGAAPAKGEDAGAEADGSQGSSSSGGGERGAIVGLAVAVVVLLCLGVVAAVLYARSRSRGTAGQDPKHRATDFVSNPMYETGGGGSGGGGLDVDLDDVGPPEHTFMCEGTVTLDQQRGPLLNLGGGVQEQGGALAPENTGYGI